MTKRSQRGAHRPLVVDATTSARLGRVRQRGTDVELRVRELLRELGVRAGRSTRRLPGSPDIVNLAAGWCVFVHGCFWHRHVGCYRATTPKRNRAFWVAKFEANRARDARVLRAVRRLGLRAIVLWECQVEGRPGSAKSRLARFLGLTVAGNRTDRRGAEPSSHS